MTLIGGGSSAFCSNNNQPFTYRATKGLGVGGSAALVLLEAYDPTTDQSSSSVVLKFSPKSIPGTTKPRQHIEHELAFMRAAIPSSSFVERIFDAYESPEYVFLLLEFVPCGDLFYHLQLRRREQQQQFKRRTTPEKEHFNNDLHPADCWDTLAAAFSESECQVLLAEIYLGIAHLHKHMFFHGDIKLENIMLDVHGHVKLVDMGHSTSLQNEHGTQLVELRGSPCYMPPELYLSRIGGRCTDWWAYGIVAYELFTGRSPWSSGEDIRSLINEIIQQDRAGVLPQHPAPWWLHSEEAWTFVSLLLQRNFSQRLGTASDLDVRASPFFSNNGGTVDWDRVMNGDHRPAFSLEDPPSTCYFSEEDSCAALLKFNEIGFDTSVTTPQLCSDEGKTVNYGLKPIESLLCM